jgi:hypothetical protein
VHRKPLLVEGPRGGGKMALAESPALACNYSIPLLPNTEFQASRALARD